MTSWPSKTTTPVAVCVSPVFPAYNFQWFRYFDGEYDSPVIGLRDLLAVMPHAFTYEPGRITCKLDGNLASNRSDKGFKCVAQLFFKPAIIRQIRKTHVSFPDTGNPAYPVGFIFGSGFTLLFEAFLMTLAKDMPVNAIARLVKEHDTRLWRVLRYYVEKSRREQDYSQVKKIGVDETSRKKGHNYISVFVDADESKVLFATEGKGAGTVDAFKKDLDLNLRD